MPSTTNLLCSQLETRLEVCDLRGADDPPLVLAPVHAQNFIPVPLQGPPGLHDKLAQPLHLLCHLMYCTKHTCILYIKHVPTLTLAAARIKLQQAHLNGGILN